ncbi:formate--tetrahydrofolate ligase [Vagococcus lutrae]|uniref:formate--tetrahydrofolate ligase n=1 Tax=Vagococcus lutrae TaxID=81947 RepID=UPI001C9855D0|nr:formate--tetrahydrofolate ligase [Vagococcus lutrae]MDT2806901.1 formate--tetrahydrofolate ligase [Vagococcus lutrae]MDT2825005.1 formate--tetrahydrofolate ligase [Vagococcus lutrae]MDT2826810.1 formate--tetrahydrofolate ligase [Vagococcus lutrae]QZN88046.1 formate--tetrahydrofolate ligase [Vagococcus lutrae]UQF18289.1 formate--tetrahydrofolate ligase [Vagococcus lutrae]
MSHLSDIEIANQVKMKPIHEIASQLGLSEEQYDLYGRYKAKIDHRELERRSQDADGKLILVTAMTPTPAGEGKTTTSVGLADGLRQIGKKAMLALREPSLGPVFGMKGGAAGGGYAQVVPMEDINLHFTGDFHAIGAANNLLAAMLDNHIHHGNALEIDTRRITWKRVVDMNDRQLRYIVDGLQGKANGVPREDGYDITVASEIMAVLCLAHDLEDLKEKLRRIIVAYNFAGEPVTAGDLKAEGAMAALLKEAMNPNLVQTLEHTPALIHGGPFANIAHGCNSLLATKLALKLADYTVTEAGFGADLGAEKFMDIKCRLGSVQPDAVVLVATIRALKMHGGVALADLGTEDVSAVEAGLPNLMKHIATIQEVYGMPVVVAINQFPTDTIAEQEAVEAACRQLGVEVAVSEVWAKGGKGALELAEKVVSLAEHASTFQYAYDSEDAIETKLNKIVQKVYGGKGVILSLAAKREMANLERLGFGTYPICVAKTQYSFSDNPKSLGAPEDFEINIKQLKVSAGAGFIVALAGDMMTMPGLPKSPAAERIDIDRDGKITGLF